MKAYLLFILLIVASYAQIRTPLLNLDIKPIQTANLKIDTPTNTATFSSYLNTYASKYSLSNENNFRALIFSQNLEVIQKHNLDTKSTYKLGINQFTGLTQDQFEKYALGELPDQPTRVSTQSLTSLRVKVEDVQQVDPQQAKDADAGAQGALTISPNLLISNYVFFNAAWDWRGVKGAITSVKDQGFCGSCYAFAVVGVAESMHMISRGSYFPNLSEQQIVDCSTENLGCNGGWRDKAMNYIKNNGLVSETSYPYTASKGSCKKNSGTWKVNSVTLNSGCAALRSAVRKGPIAVGVAASSWSGYASGVFQCPSNGNVNHAVVLIGYTSLRHWIIKNSWGKTWGDDGYMTISNSADCKICVRAGVGATVN